MRLTPTTAVLLCAACGAASATTERGWRAYRRVELDGRHFLLIVCPCCSECLYGEDEERS